MTEKEYNLLNRLLDGSLSTSQREEADRMLAASEPLRREKARLERMQGKIRAAVFASGQKALRPFFSDRVMRRLTYRNQTEEEFAGSLAWLFRRVAVAGLLVGMTLAAFNLASPEPYRDRQTAIEAALSLPPVMWDLAYELDLPEQTQP